MAEVMVKAKLDMNDKCPACGLKIKNMPITTGEKNPDGLETKILLRGDNFTLICTKCGVIFVPKSLLPALVELTKPKTSKIVDPKTGLPAGAGGLFIPKGR